MQVHVCVAPAPLLFPYPGHLRWTGPHLDAQASGVTQMHVTPSFPRPLQILLGLPHVRGSLGRGVGMGAAVGFRG